MSCGVGRRCSSDLALTWLWFRLAAVALIQLLAWELPNAVGAALKNQTKTKPNQTKSNQTKQKTKTKQKKTRKWNDKSSSSVIMATSPVIGLQKVSILPGCPAGSAFLETPPFVYPALLGCNLQLEFGRISWKPWDVGPFTSLTLCPSPGQHTLHHHQPHLVKGNVEPQAPVNLQLSQFWAQWGEPAAPSHSSLGLFCLPQSYVKGPTKPNLLFWKMPFPTFLYTVSTSRTLIDVQLQPFSPEKGSSWTSLTPIVDPQSRQYLSSIARLTSTSLIISLSLNGTKPPIQKAVYILRSRSVAVTWFYIFFILSPRTS